MLISCLTITRNRPAFLRRAVEAFLAQTWPDKELVVVVDRRGDLGWMEGRLDHPSIRYVVPPAVEHLAALRNASVALAQGELVCTWDDDDLYHPERLDAQARRLLEGDGEALVLGDVLHYFEDTGTLHATRWEKGMPATLICRRERIPAYPTTRLPEEGERGSDSPVLAELWSRGRCILLSGHPHLYVRTYHGGNVWDRDHHESIVRCYGVPLNSEKVAPELRRYAPHLATKAAQ